MTPYEKRLEELKQEIPQTIWNCSYEACPTSIARKVTELAQRQLEREAEAVKAALNYYGMSATIYLHSHGYISDIEKGREDA